MNTDASRTVTVTVIQQLHQQKNSRIAIAAAAGETSSNISCNDQLNEQTGSSRGSGGGAEGEGHAAITQHEGIGLDIAPYY